MEKNFELSEELLEQVAGGEIDEHDVRHALQYVNKLIDMTKTKAAGPRDAVDGFLYKLNQIKTALETLDIPTLSAAYAEKFLYINYLPSIFRQEDTIELDFNINTLFVWLEEIVYPESY